MELKDRVAGAFWQRTLKDSIQCSGVGLHGGEHVQMTLHPAEADTGIVFRRSDVRDTPNEILARFDYVSDTRMCTTLRNAEGVSVMTVEHLMAALSGCGIDNLIVEINGPEIPVMDGSAEPFVFLIECVGVVEQDTPRAVIQILEPVIVRKGDCVATLEPAEGFSIQFGIDFDNAVIGRQEISLNLTEPSFKAEICRARTFGFLHEVESLREAGLAKGGSLDNAVVLNGDTVMNAGGLRYANEFVRHKVLDCIGDLYLAGGPILGNFRGEKTGHALNNELLRTLFANMNAWTRIRLEPPYDYVADPWVPEAIAVNA
ncbi:MAG: UDP-3-O-acyl-N-acetylglucosamine deacetylase [Rhodospirillaceae bacterium]|jgi:UDP-3-O-[3-hydroxymyristoyl] N-acetylglucosamine deacetylase|nr:UDP-3-O-acyl-N-acetylglucosamine deacetylase [Rhodospirillaceae bacterium]MBT5665630.1 UDP-3-O-acyl-N-acetylglucosamine deacetylase [Rhodospirillaceae bacterium]MBT5809328.1 UDP-3-O-acyl-N-acetylglucosamine deacetylase [Rhodospirillaceae bacterium]